MYSHLESPGVQWPNGCRCHFGPFLDPQNRERMDWVLEPEHDKSSELEFGKAERNCGKHLHTYILNAKPLFSEFQ